MFLRRAASIGGISLPGAIQLWYKMRVLHTSIAITNTCEKNTVELFLPLIFPAILPSRVCSEQFS